METLPKSTRLCGRDRFDRLFRDGARASCGKVAVRALANESGETAVAAIAGKALGGAVERNRMRRRLRAAFRIQRETLPGGFDLALLARPGLMETTWLDLRRDMAKALERAMREAIRSRLPPSGE